MPAAIPATPSQPLCDACDRLLTQARSRLWLATPWLHSRHGDGWIGGFVGRLAAAKRKGLDVRVYCRPEATNAKALDALKQAGVTVVSETPGARHLHAKVLLTEGAVLVSTVSLTDQDLGREDARFVVAEAPERVGEFAFFLERLAQADPPEEATPPAPAEILLPARLRPFFQIEQLNPMQAAAVPQVLQGSRNLVIASPTGSGKTLVAEVALLHAALEGGRAGVYLAPMRAIASEKRDDWRRLEEAGLKVYKTTGEDDAFDPAQAQAADIIVSTPEKWDAVSRRALPAALTERIGSIVCDEVHLVDDEHRGPGLEALLARLHLAFPAARLIAMSGTLLNVEAIARWLRADVVRSTWRPVRLHTAVVPYPEAGNWRDDESGRNALAAEIAATTLREEGAVVVFCGSRKGVEDCAESLGEALSQKAAGLAAVENAALRRCLARGVGFHHAGLARGDRAAVETAFRDGTIKVLVATSTVAAGVNLPARVVVVRDLTLGTDELGANVLLQMAGRAGRPGLESEGRCYVLAPMAEAARVARMLEGHPLDSHLGDDIATHLNTEIALGIVARRDDVRAWYARTFHAHVARKPVDLGAALGELLQGGFVREEKGVLAPTDLGRATNDLMVRVPTARVLEGWLAGRPEVQEEAGVLETDLLLVACGLPVEFADLPVRRGDEEVLAQLAQGEGRLAGWQAGRLRHLALAAAILSGRPVADLPLEGAASLAAAVQTEVPRFLRFLSRRAAERSPSLPAVMVVAADLATCLEFGIAERGAGAFVDALKLGFRSDESRRRKVLAAYAELRAKGATNLADAVPHLAPRPRRYALAWAAAGCSLLERNGALWAGLGPGPAPCRLHLRLVCDGHAQRLIRAGADPRLAELLPLTALGRRGKRTVGVEVMLTPETMSAPWVYVQGTTEVTVPAPIVDLDGADAALRAEGAAPEGGERLRPVLKPPDGDLVLAELRRQAALPPPAVRQAAAILGLLLPRAYDKAEAVVRLLGRRQVVEAAAKPRPLALVAAAPALTPPEGACLGAALLGAMGVEVDLLRGSAAGQSTILCAWKGDGHWYGLPLAPAATTPDGPAVPAWGEPVAGEEPPAAVWALLRDYEQLSERKLAFVLYPPTAGAGGTPANADGPRCPQCEGEMRLRKGRFGQFWGCLRYPSCRGTRPA